MKLLTNPASPFGRKVKVAALETGLFERLELHNLQTSAVAPDSALLTANPLGKIPCLVLDDGAALYDSRVIAEYLDTLHDGPSLFPVEGRWQVLRLQALGDGLADAALLARYETLLRPEPLRWPAWAEGQLAKAGLALDDLEDKVGQLGEQPHIGSIAVACGLGYLDLRHPALGWREGRPGLTGWFERFAARPSMQRTDPTA